MAGRQVGGADLYKMKFFVSCNSPVWPRSRAGRLAEGVQEQVLTQSKVADPLGAAPHSGVR
jgi:hypothetical protein